MMRPLDIAPVGGGNHLVVLTTHTLKAIVVRIDGCYFREFYAVCTGMLLSVGESASYMDVMHGVVEPPPLGAGHDSLFSALEHIIGKNHGGAHYQVPHLSRYGLCAEVGTGGRTSTGREEEDGSERCRARRTFKMIYRMPIRNGRHGGSARADTDLESSTSIVNVPQWLWHWKPSVADADAALR